VGILALVFTIFCGFGWILGIIAWVMGDADLKAMAAGHMDPAGESITKAGKVCGIISVILAVVVLVIYVVLAIVSAIFGAA
jgi:t-SNARE complex subunit (syntaxin)